MSTPGTQAGEIRVGDLSPVTGTSGSEIIRIDRAFVPEPSGTAARASALLAVSALGLGRRLGRRVPSRAGEA